MATAINPSTLRTRLWRERHRQESRDYQRAYMAKLRLDPEFRAKAAARLRARYAADPVPHRQRALAWARANPEKACALTQRRRARQAAAPGDFTVEEFAALCEAHDHRCVYCGCHTKLTADHVIPLSRGGSNYISNIVPACRPCNASKGTRTAEEFLAARAA